MAEHRITHRAALAGNQAISGTDISLAPLPEGHVIQLIGISDRTKVPTPTPQSIVHDAGLDQWFVVGDAPLSHQQLTAYVAMLPAGAVWIDQSHGRVRMSVAGRNAERVLSKGTAVDLAVFPVGSGTMTLVGHIAVHLARTAVLSFELMVLRGFAESLWHHLVRMSAEFTARR